MSVLIQTSFGDITVDLWTQKHPNTTYNFLKLCKAKHYNNALLIQVQKNHTARVLPQHPTTVYQMISKKKQDQYFNDQIDHGVKFKQIGYLATANRGPNKNNSEFFITLTKADLSSLNGKHTIFGKVQQGLDILRKINDAQCDVKSRPQMNIRILHTFVLDDPFDEPQQLQYPVQSPQLARDSDRLEAIEHLQMLEKYEKQQDVNETIKKQKAKKQAVTLEMLGDLPDANIKPPENILFVCKLNPITQQRDLEIIFSRFGPIKSVQIVRDWKTGQSLQYGFIQFETPKACEQAYLKMNNVLIDDRRIQVDFSQSVSKFMPRNKKPNQPQKKMVKQQEYSEKKDHLVRSGRRVQENYKYNLITSKPNYQSQKSKYHQRNQSQNLQDFHRKQRICEEKYQSKEQERSNHSVQRKKDKKKKQKKNKRQRSSSQQRDRKRSSFSSSQDSYKEQKSKTKKKSHKIEKDRKKQKKHKKQKKAKKQKSKHQSDSD